MARPGIRVFHPHAHARAVRYHHTFELCGITYFETRFSRVQVVEGTRTSGPGLVVGGRRAPGDEIAMLGLGSRVRKCCASSRRRDVEEGPTRTRAWVEDADVRLAQFSSTTAGTACTESRRVTAGTGTDALRGVGHFGTSQPRPLRSLLHGGCFWYPPALSGTDVKAPPDPPCEQIPAAFHVELVLPKDEDQTHNRSCSFGCSWFYARRRSWSRYASLSTCSACRSSYSYRYRESSRAGAATRWGNGDTSERARPYACAAGRGDLYRRHFSEADGRMRRRYRAFNAEASVARPVSAEVVECIPHSRSISHSSSR
ncbi:hypothetical protein B0H13DRAFT_1898526 [Mycena leptocephala]|nr:hypothetical protein B0H13DRAFT_1898526 [Mycena leptocephala]